MISKPNGAYVYADELVNSILAKGGMTIHYYVYVLPLVEEAIRELSKHSVDTLHHTLLPRYKSDAGRTGAAMNLFALPDDFTDWMTIGVRDGEYWRPLGVNHRLLPFLQPASGNTQPLATLATENGPVTVGNWSAGSTTTGALTGYGWLWDRFAQGTVTVSAETGTIVVPGAFPYEEIYLVYSAAGAVVPGTHIPRKAQEAVESYVFWKLAFNKAQHQIARERLAVHQAALKRLRRSNLKLTPTDITRLVYENYGPLKM